MFYLWNWYIDYLWNYDSNSWVATIAYAFRIWAILAILPSLVLALLDVTSYVIARTLGDPTASTSHKSSFPTQPPPRFELKVAGADDTSPLSASPAVPVIPIEVSPPQDKELPSPSDISPPKFPAPGAGAAARTTMSTSDSLLSAFFVDGEVSEDDGAARLAGVGVFSPVASMPGSPVVSRRNLLERDGEEDGGSESSDESGSLSSPARRGVLLRSRDRDRRDYDRELGHERASSEGGAIGGGESTSGESSFALLDREESFEDAGAHIRRRIQGTTSADDDDDA